MTPSFGRIPASGRWLPRPWCGAEEEICKAAIIAGRTTSRQGSAREAEQHDVAVGDYVFLALGAGDALFARRLPAAKPDEIGIGHRFGADEALLEVRMDHPGRCRCLVAAVYRPGADFLLPGREVALQAEKVIGRVREPIEPRLGDSEGVEEILPVFRGELGELGLYLRREDDDFGLFAGGDDVAQAVHMRVPGGQLVLRHIRRVQHRLRREEVEAAIRGTFVVARNDGAREAPGCERWLQTLEQPGLESRLRVAGPGGARGAVEPLFDGYEVGEAELDVDDLPVADRVHRAHDVLDIVVLETANDVHDRVHLPDIREKLVPQSFALARALHEPGDVDELDRGRHGAFRLHDGGERVQPRIGDGDNAGVGFDGREGVVGDESARRRERVEERGLSHVRKADDSESQHLPVEPRHRLLDPFRRPGLHGLRHRVQERLYGGALLGFEIGQHEVSEIIEVGGRWPDPDPKPRVVLPSERSLHTLEAVMAAARAGSPEAEAAQRRRHVVDENQEVPGGVERVRIEQRRDGRAAAVHVGVRLDQADRTTGELPADFARPRSAAERAEPPARGEAIGEHEPGVVSGVLVLGARIAKTDDREQQLLLLAGVLRLGLRLPDELLFARRRGLFGWGSRSCLFRTGCDDRRDRKIGVVQDLRLLDLHVTDEQRLADREIGDIDVDTLRDVAGEDLDLDLAEHLVEDAAEVPHPLRNSHDMDRHLYGDLLVCVHFVEVEVQDVDRLERVTLDFPEQRADRSAAVHHHLEYGRGTRARECARNRAAVDHECLGFAAVPVDDGGNLPLAPEGARRALAG